jgi:DNA topoisomerase-3
VNFDSLSDNQKLIYDLIAKSIIAAHYPDVKLKELDVITLVDNKYTFKSKGKEIIDKGWYEVIPTNKEDNILPELTTEQEGIVEETSIKEGHTKPLARWSEADVVVMMANAYRELPKHVRSDYSTKELALGTVATRAEIVKGLKERGYINVKANKVYITEKGRILSVAMEGINLFTSPIATGNMQKHLNEEIKDHETYEHFIKGIKRRVKATFNGVMNSHHNWDFSSIDLSRLPKKVQKQIASNKPIGVCPICDQNVVDKGALYACEKEPECEFKFWKKQYGRVIELEHVQSFLEKGTTPLLEFFSKKKNKAYHACIVWDKNKKEVKMNSVK